MDRVQMRGPTRFTDETFLKRFAQRFLVTTALIF